MQMWTKIGSHHLNTLLRNRRFPRKPDMTINIPGLKTPINIDDNYGLRLTAYYRVSDFYYGTKVSYKITIERNLAAIDF